METSESVYEVPRPNPVLERQPNLLLEKIQEAFEAESQEYINSSQEFDSAALQIIENLKVAN